MLRLMVLLGALLFLASCQMIQGQSGYGRPSLAQIPGMDNSYVADTNWIITCVAERRDVTGRIPTQGHCRLEKYNRRAIIRVDATGPKVLAPDVHMTPCRSAPTHFGVDGVSLVGKTYSEKISAMIAGQTFGRETQSSWPKCWISVEETSLANFSTAYEAFREKALKYGYVIP